MTPCARRIEDGVGDRSVLHDHRPCFREDLTGDEEGIVLLALGAADPQLEAERTLLAETRSRELVVPPPRPEWLRAEIYGSIPHMLGTQMLSVVLQGIEWPAVAIVVTGSERGLCRSS